MSRPGRGRRLALAGLALATLMGGSGARAQIVNVLPLLDGSAEDGWTGRIKGGLDWRTGNVDLLIAKAGALVTFRAAPHTLLLSTSGEVGWKGGADFLERVFGHLRWQWMLGERVTWESYAQVASDRFKRLELRALAGTGPRFELTTGSSGSLAAAASYMLEREIFRTCPGDAPEDCEDPPPETNHRASLYVTGNLALDDALTLLHTTYFQPRLDDPIADFRVLSETSLSLALTDHLAVSIDLVFAWDQDPPNAVERLDTTTQLSFVVSL